MNENISDTSAANAVSAGNIGNGKKKNEPAWKVWTGRILHFSIPVVISVLLVVWLARKIDIHEMKHVIQTECNFWWIALMMVITMVSHMIRGTRWGIQLRGAGLQRVPPVVEWISIFGAYALNLLFPFLGETWRCVFMAKRENAKLSTVVGTDIGDRVTDFISIMAIFILAVALAKNYMVKFLEHYSLGQRLLDYFEDVWLWMGVIAVVGLIWIALRLFRHVKIIEEIDGSLARTWAGFKVLFTMKGKWAYLILTIGIWVCYFMETYVGFHAFPFTRALIDDPGSAYGLIPGLVVFVFGSFSMAVPSNGGLGPWNLAVMFALSLYGVSDTRGAAYSVVMWGCQAAMLVALGIFSAVYIMIARRKKTVSSAG